MKVAPSDVSITDDYKKKKCCCCRTRYRLVYIIIGIILLIGVGAGTFILITELLKNKVDTVTLKTKFVTIQESNIVTRRRRLLDSAVSAASVDVNVEEISYAIGRINLCQEIEEEWYTHSNQQYVQYKPNFDTCVTILDRGEVRNEHGTDNCASAQSLADKYINFADQSELDSKLNQDVQVPLGTYKLAEVTFNRVIRLKADLTLTNGSTSINIHTKACGVGVCGSVCETADNVRDCRGTITNTNEYKGSTIGETNSLGDIWSTSYFKSTSSDIAGTDPNGYWRRCDHNMVIGPSQQIYATPHNDADSILVQFVEPLIISQNLTNTTLQLAVNIDGLISGKIKPFNTQVGGLGPTNFYGVSDGFMGFDIQSPTLAPILTDKSVYRYDYKLYIRKNSIPYCMKGTQQFGKDGVPNGYGLCHPCHLYDKDCKEGSTIVNNQIFNSSGLQVAQEFDLKLSLFYESTNLNQVDVYSPRSASVARMYNSSIPVNLLLDDIFYIMRVEGIKKNSWDSLISLWENLFGAGRFPRIRDLTPLSSQGQTGTAKIMVKAGNYNVYVQVNTELLRIVEQ